MADAGVKTLEQVIACTLNDAFVLLSGRGSVRESSLDRNNASQRDHGASWKA